VQELEKQKKNHQEELQHLRDQLDLLKTEKDASVLAGISANQQILALQERVRIAVEQKTEAIQQKTEAIQQKKEALTAERIATEAKDVAEAETERIRSNLFGLLNKKPSTG